MSERKSDADEIVAHLTALRQRFGQSRGWWSSFLFHFTDVQNAVGILTHGRLLARNKCQMATDIASPQVILQTDDKWKDYVRFYFRPRTPTQFRNEGFRPKGQLGELGAHCPMPVFFLFDAASLLTLRSTEFSEGSLAAGSSVGSNAAYFKSIPFEKVYHNSGLRDEEKSSIKFHRHAEAIIPEQVDLSALKFIYCRSEAEFETLLALLAEADQACLERFRDRIGNGRSGNLFFGRWTFIESVALESNAAKLNFNTSSEAPGPFRAQLTVSNLENGERYQWEADSFQANKQLSIRIPQLTKPTPYDVRFLLDDKVAYARRFEVETGPVVTGRGA